MNNCVHAYCDVVVDDDDDDNGEKVDLHAFINFLSSPFKRWSLCRKIFYYINVEKCPYRNRRDRGSRFYDECRSSSHRSRCSRSRSNDRNRGSRRSNEERSRSRDYKSRKHE
ncbi:conserved hypothetical protein [Trichinella spiralis]|uniref:hypothetical protein n=1 Tax=Trichinella spiralis TaxID=6334 RepID=UPI0001EFC249|nr:conserved hypothetical protein [Trichinella spiralis]